ncbi:MAG: XdhC/CoxI family protein [Deltaproteobacteria bacterium]|nr:XdhC/CoxI family protein [Deltaproteobacteria bacterium]
MEDLYAEIVKLKAEGRSSALATIIGTKGSTPRETGAKMLVRDDGTILGTVGGGCLEGQVIVEAVMAMRDEKPRTIHHDLTGSEADRAGMICGGVLDIYVEPIVPTPTVIIFGGGHISLFVSKISVMAGFQVTVIDDRAEFANAERFPEAGQVIAEAFSAAFPGLRVNRSAYLVIVTRGHAGDQEVLEWALTTEARYIGMIGSKKKIRTLYQNLEAKGVNREAFSRVHAPIGLEIGALTPEEIAVAIVGQMIQVRRASSAEGPGPAKACAG